MKRVFTFITASTLSLGAIAQQQITTAPLINGGFENWESAIAGNSQVGQEPVQWNSFMSASGTLTGQAAIQVQSSNDKRPGSAGTTSLRVNSRSIFGINANGNVTTGRINMGSVSADDAEENYAKTIRTDSKFNHPMTSRPDSIVFWAKYNPTGNDASYRARMNAVIHGDIDYIDPERDNQAGSRVARATINFGTTNGQWKRFSVPFDYNFAGTDPRYILITFTTCEFAGECGGSDVLYIDDAELIYNKVVTAVSDNYTINAGSYLDLNGANGILANDYVNYGDLASTFTIAQAPASGQIISAGGNVMYVPTAGFFGTDYFRYRVKHAADTNVYAEAVVTVTVNYVAPAEQTDVVASDDFMVIYPGVVGIIDVLANDFKHADNEFDLEGLQILTPAQNGTATFNELGQIVYQSAASFVGADSLQYIVCDNQAVASCDTAWVRISSDFSSVNNSIFNDLVVYTNGDVLVIEGSDLEGATYTIYTTAGALIQQGTVVNAVNFTASAGVYLVQITAANGETRKRIIKQ